MAKKESRPVIAPDGDRAAKSLSQMSETMHGHLLDTALRAGHGHAIGNVAGNKAPDNDHAMQRGAFVPQRVFAASGQASQGGFQQGGAAGADYQTTSVNDTPDCDSQGPTGY